MGKHSNPFQKNEKRWPLMILLLSVLLFSLSTAIVFFIRSSSSDSQLQNQISISDQVRLYNQYGNNQPDETLERNCYNGLKTYCPRSGGDSNIFPLDLASLIRFDNTYFKLILWGKRLLNSDEVLLTGNVGKTMELVME
ncbi:hypothetical protein Vadar_028439 [Vaccinium darrowii]|uniref:Uncharacterized protein n=1 Tax=Vaccinium darrowii TaxID=229202 RepID=A0ACB7Y2W2_9ERIC|nr:hypothetical protein Vadar_028439 [Vaccinium darrowii]